MSRLVSILSLVGILALLGSATLASSPDSFPALPAIQNGDTNGDWELDLSDVVYLYSWLYLGGPAPAPYVCGAEASIANGDANGDLSIDVSDGIHILSYLFVGGPPPVEIVCGAGTGSGGAAAVQRPLSDFLSTQGTYCQDVLGDGTCYLFVPPAPNFLGWTNDTDTNDDGVEDKPFLFAGVDYAGLANDHFGGAFGTEIAGSITERPLSDGRAEVHILVRADNANGWVIAPDLAGDVLAQIAGRPTLFGHRPQDVVAGAGAALGKSFFQVSFVNDAPGAPIPDMLQLIFAPGPAQELKGNYFLWRAKGPLTEEYGVPEGTPGMCAIQQIGLGARGSKDHVVDGDGFPAEFLELHVLGRK